MPFAEMNDGVSLHYRDSGTGRPLVFLHGVGGSVDMWNYQVLVLQSKFRCICLDQRGHGASDKPASDYSFTRLCEDLHELLEQLDINDIVLVGHSFAGALCVLYMLDHNADNRVSRSALVGGTVPRLVRSESEPYGAEEKVMEELLGVVRTSFPEALAAMAPMLLHRQDLQPTLNWILATAVQLPAYAAHQLYAGAIELDLRQRLESVHTSMALLHGRHDQIADPRWAKYAAERLPRCQLTWFENSGHYAMLEEPEAVSNALADFAQSQ